MRVPPARTLPIAFWLAIGLLTTVAAPAAVQTPSDPTGQSIETLVQKADALIQAGQYDAALRNHGSWGWLWREQSGSPGEPAAAVRSHSGRGAAGTEQRREDGVLTALEAAGLDLRGMQLLVLSACETGLGEVRQGEGVYGLRRALVLAGAETQVMSLWKVSDAATAALMGEFYRRLGRGESRMAALRAARLGLLRGELRPQSEETRRAIGLSPGKPAAKRPAKWQHPYYWAAFVISGDWSSITFHRLPHTP